jgi:hypothetical protein
MGRAAGSGGGEELARRGGAFGALSAEALCAKAEATPAHFWRRYWAGGRTSARRACRQRSDQRSKRTMTVKTLVLFPDTNLFVQCRALSEIDWTDLKEFDEINLIVSRPIQSEIDNQKNKGRDRLGRRARETSSLFREIILGSEEFKEIRAATPIVRLFVRPELKVNAELSDRLNYQERDDQLVGTAHAFQCEHSDIDVRVLTDDTGPMASAKMVGLSVLPIPNNWLLPPENTETEKKINTLTQEVSRYKRAEPDFQLKWLNSSNEEISAINIEMIRYIEITKSQATELMAKIVERFPLSKDFGSNEPSERQSEIPVFGNLRMKEIFVPATAEEIAKYRDEYPKWLQCCEDIIRNYHKTQQQHAVAPSFTFQATNTGTRPAKHVLVTFFTKGDFSILPPTSGDKKKSKKGALTFPAPDTADRALAKCRSALSKS